MKFTRVTEHTNCDISVWYSEEESCRIYMWPGYTSVHPDEIAVDIRMFINGRVAINTVCAMDGVAAFVVEELLELMGGFDCSRWYDRDEWEPEFSNKMVEMSTALGRWATLPKFHAYKESQRAKHEVP